MKRRFAVAVDSVSDEQEKKFMEYIKENGFGWWHWLKNFYLVVDNSDKLTPSKLRSDVMEIIPDTYLLVIEIEDKSTWSGFGPGSEKFNMFEWLKNTWDKD